MEHKCKYERDRWGPIKCLIDWHEDIADKHDHYGNEEKREFHVRKAQGLRMWLFAQSGERFYNDRHFEEV